LKSFLDVGFYFITDISKSVQGHIADVTHALQAGCSLVQYREKQQSTRIMIETATALREICRGKAYFLVNDRVDVALSVDADGVHLGHDDMPIGMARRLLGHDKLIGFTVRTLDEAKEAEQKGVDYLALGPIFPSMTKPDLGPACGPGLIEEVKQQISVPLVAIGGITLSNAPAVLAAGADTLAAISSVVGSEDIYRSVFEFESLIKEYKKP
jgi:thiamine-phosphate pyrophosphorylase